nr:MULTISPECIES: hypothetical protein [unclassified Janthinobacterium]
MQARHAFDVAGQWLAAGASAFLPWRVDPGFQLGQIRFPRFLEQVALFGRERLGLGAEALGRWCASASVNAWIVTFAVCSSAFRRAFFFASLSRRSATSAIHFGGVGRVLNRARSSLNSVPDF